MCLGFWPLDWKTLVLLCLVRSVCTVSLPVRKSCGIVECVSFLKTGQHLCTSPPPLLTCLFCCPPPRLDNDGIDLLMSFLKVSITKAWRWCGRFESHVWTVWWDRSWLLTSFLFPISVRVKKEDLCWWSNETTLLQEPGATCARTAREWVMGWRCRRADLATSARYNSKDIRARITYRLIRDTLISWNYVICGALTVFHVWQTSPYSHWRRSSCRGIPVTGTHRTQNQVRIKVPETSILDIRCPRRASQDV